MKLAFFFSYSDCCCSSGDWGFCGHNRQSEAQEPRANTRTSWMFSRVPEPLSFAGDPSSLTSLKLARRPSWPLCLALWGNLTPRRDLPVIEAKGSHCVDCLVIFHRRQSDRAQRALTGLGKCGSIRSSARRGSWSGSQDCGATSGTDVGAKRFLRSAAGVVASPLDRWKGKVEEQTVGF
jgi:hypothetical protein